MQRSLFTVEELNPIPATGWSPPKEFPRLEHASAIALDTETKDLELTIRGPGWARKGSHLVGISCAIKGMPSFYLPMRHEIGGGNFDPAIVLRWAKRELCRKGQPKIGANILYDLGGLLSEGVPVEGPFIDVLYAEALLDEHQKSYSLDAVAERRLGEHKTTNALYAWIGQAYGNKSNPRRDIYRSPAALAGPYAESDADLPLRIWEVQKPLLEEQGLLELFYMECALIPILLQMQMRGSPINQDALDPTIDEMHKRKKDALHALKKMVGFHVDPDDKNTLIKAFDTLGLAYPKTQKGNPSFAKDFLEKHPHEIGRYIREVRRWGKYIQYAEGYRDKFNDNGIIHGSYHPLRGENGGTIVGRFSSSDPNLTNIPSRDPEAKRLLRGLFLPHPGERWRSRDYSQIQFRIMVHYAMGLGSDEARAKYQDDPTTDYHDMAKEQIMLLTGRDLPRKSVKGINFGLAFTMGPDKLALELGMSVDEVLDLLEAYHAGMPWLRHTTDRVSARAEERGYIRGIGGRRHRFNLWEPRCWALKDFVPPSPDRDSVAAQVDRLVKNPPKGIKGRLFTGTKRAYTHLGLNRLAQDGEGTTMKKAMVACWEQGVYDVIGVPLNTVHDEKNHSDPMTKESEEAFREELHIMQTIQSFKVPIMVSDEVGPNWADISAILR